MFDPSIDYGLLPSLTGYALRRASILDFSGFGESVGDRGITPLRYSMLELVGANPGLSQVELAEIMGLSRPAATLMIDFWQARECIARHANEADRRSYGIHLTDAGRQALATLQQLVREHDSRLTSSLSGDELRQLRLLLDRLNHPASRRPRTKN
ncbi:MarR family winged helix-turn-helix transcriptional regulator [Sphingomonas canadensis]|uniref:MarR family winged helix-turn-helix transcriptional regulator n=1 Tax=Sphingomonas canadensis TaxID=1219257 RepID=A0ABW3H2H0_9SPHN|nr:MarR family transcriptional regulator [Sphingomonas canadensis]MCW3834731.1 MarR family transcriptional regulator [Sphingomonas canadensis]